MEITTSSESVILKAVDKIYDAVINGSVPGTDSAAELAESYLAEYKNPLDAANALVRWQNAKAAFDGALTGLGGFLTMLAALPVNVASVLFIQIRMIVAIAYIGGVRDFKDEKVRTIVKCCLVGESISNIAKNAGIKIVQEGVKGAATKMILELPVVHALNRVVGTRIVATYGPKMSSNFVKGIPLLGALIGAVFDGVSTNIVGNATIKTFIEEKSEG